MLNTGGAKKTGPSRARPKVRQRGGASESPSRGEETACIRKPIWEDHSSRMSRSKVFILQIHPATHNAAVDMPAMRYRRSSGQLVRRAFCVNERGRKPIHARQRWAFQADAKQSVRTQEDEREIRTSKEPEAARAYTSGSSLCPLQNIFAARKSLSAQTLEA